MKFSTAAAAVAALFAVPPAAAPVLAQSQQQVKPPIAVYWLSAETNAGMGMGMGGMPSGLGGLLPSSMRGGKRLHLDLGSSRPASGEPRAEHAIPAGMAMGASLPLVGPQQVERTPRREEPTEGSYEQPKGRMLIYWGCGETVRQGQPVVIDFSKLAGPEAARAFRGTRVISRQSPPSAGRSRSYGEWPNRVDSKAVPEQASLTGDHVVAGNYAPEIRFGVDAAHDFMAPVAFDPVQKTAAGAFRVKWQAIPTALGYFASAAGQGEQQNDFVLWSSSDAQEMGQLLMDYLPPAEVQRLVKEKVVLAPATTECAVPAGIFRNEGAMFNFIAYGDELNVVYPPRPRDPKQVWEQQYAVKLRLKSTGMTMLAQDSGGGRTRRSAPSMRETPAAQQPAPQDTQQGQQAGEQTAPQQPNPADAVREGVNILRGIFGR